MRTNIAHLLLSLCVFALVTTSSVWLWDEYQDQVKKDQLQTINTLGEHTRSRIWGQINADIDQLRNFANRIEFTEGDFFNHWQQDAAQLVDLDSSIRFVEWIDSNMVIKDAIPIEENKSIIGLDLHTVEYRIEGWQRSRDNGTLNITPWSEMIQGGMAFLVDAPVFIDNTFYGTLSAGFDFTHDLNLFFEDIPLFHMHLYDQNGSQFYCSNSATCATIHLDRNFLFNGLINVKRSRDIWWKMEFFPTQNFFSKEQKLTSWVSLALSLFLSVTLAIATYFILKTNRQEKNTQAINDRLENLNETLAAEKIRAEDASRVKSEFLSNMSHEIRTPLNIIQGLVLILAENKEPEKQPEYVEILRSSTTNLLSLLNNILDLDRIEAGLLQVQSHRFQPVKKIQELRLIFQQSYQQKGIELRFETPEDPKAWVVGDEVKFAQILSNFIQNALKFTDHGHVTIYYEHYLESEDMIEVIVRVKDTGIGIPSDQLSMIFERFNQLDSGYRKRYSGSGLGLAINYELVNLMGGDIVVSSEEGKGTEFVVTLKFKEDEVSKNSVETPEKTLIKDFSGKKCLIVEDNELNVLVVSKMVESLGFSWIAVDDGEKGVNAYFNGKFDLLLMDLHMPVMDGMQASKLILQKDPKAPIIMLSANVTKEAIEQAAQAGINHYLTKPVSKERLLEIINEIITVKNEIE